METVSVSLDSLFNWFFTPVMIFGYIFACVLYLYSVYSYKKNYKKQEIINKNIINKILFVGWNLIASVFSLLCFVESVSNASNELITNGFYNHICDSTILYKYPSYGIFAYVITKPLEFIDTFLLMLYNKPIIFLHWYHHVLTVLNVLFIAINPIRHSSMGIWFGLINLFVHTIMYLYYALTAFKNPFNGFLRRISFIITIIQLLQMFIGTYIVYSSTWCINATENKYEIILYGGMYFSYIILFSNLLFKKLKIY